MKNMKSILMGVLFALFFIFFFNGVFQYLLAVIVGGDIKRLIFTFSGFSPVIVLTNTTGYLLNSVLSLSPFLITILFIEISFVILSKSELGSLRFSTIVFTLILTGFLMLSLFYGLVQLVLFPINSSPLGKLITVWQIEGNQIYVLIIFIVVMLLAYLQVVQKRIMQYLSVNNK